ncbi:MAG TPA: hypothetical protein VGF55_19050 [Gemmataceae bacterium]
MTVPCPYCNAPVPVPQPPPTGGRVTCPRCEETVTVGDTGTGPSVSPAAAPPGPAAEPSRPTNRAVAGIVVAVMLGMAAIGLAYALRTVEFRRANDLKGVQPPEPDAESRPVPPGEWPELGYLPDEVQVVAGVRMAAALASPAGRTLLAELGLAEAGKGKILGLTPQDVDRLVIGASHRTLPPRVTGVIRTLSPMDDVWTRQAVRANRTTDHHGKTLLRGRLWANGPEGAIWRADPHTLVAALLPEDFDRIPATPRATAPLPDLLRRVDPAAVAWVVASGEPINLALRLAGVPPPAAGAAGKEPDALVMSLRADGAKVTLAGQVRCPVGTDEEGLARVMESMRKAGLTVERSATGDWQTLTVTADADKLAAWLQRR